MHSLMDLKELAIQQGFKVKKSGGWFLDIGRDRYTMLSDVYYLNNKPITKKELLAKFKKKKR